MLMQLINPDNYIFTIHATASMLVGSALAVLGIYVLVREHWSRISVIFWLFSVCISTWLIGFGLVYASIAPGPALCWIRFNQMGVTFIPSTILALTAAMVQRSRQYRTLVGISAGLSSLFCLGVAATNLHVKGLYRYFWGYFPEYGPLGVLFLAYFLGIMIFVLSLCWMEYRKTGNLRHRKRMKGMLTAFSIGYLGSFDFFAAFGVPLYPFGYVPMSIYLAITAFVILRYRLVDITPELAVGRIFEAMRGAVVVADLDNRIRVTNTGASLILGRSDEGLEGEDLASLIELPEALRSHAGFRDNDVHMRTMSWTNREGRRMDLEISAAPLMDRDKHPAGVVYIMNDVTERIRAGQKLIQYAEDLKQSNEDVLSFAYIVSHDLRAPLVSIKGFTAELQHGLREIEDLFGKCAPHLSEQESARITAALREDVPEAMKFISSSVDRMERLINAILTLSRLGQRTLKPEPVDMKETAKAILSSLAYQIEQRKTTVTMGELPVITADKFAMEQTLGNLLDNALKYLEPGREGAIAITAEPGADEIVFHVADNGRGIAKDDMHKVFELFRRAGKQDVPGEGMGLAYVKALVRRHGGNIWCESEPGKGTIFSFTVSARFDGNQPKA